MTPPITPLTGYYGLPQFQKQLTSQISYVAYAGHKETDPPLAEMSLLSHMIWKYELTMPERVKPFEIVVVQSFLSRILLPFKLCFKSEAKNKKTIQGGNVVMIRFNSQTEFLIDDHTFFHKSHPSNGITQKCFDIESNYRKGVYVRQRLDSSISFFGLDSQRFMYSLEISVSLFGLLNKLYVINFWHIIATTLNMLMFMFYLQLKVSSDNAKTPNLNSYSSIIFKEFMALKILAMNLICALIRSYVSDVLKELIW